MRLRALGFFTLALAGTVAGSFQLATIAAGYFEQDRKTQLGEALGLAEQDWVSLRVDGLNVALTGEAPDESSRFRAIETVRLVAGNRMIEDRTSVRVADVLPPPPFALEILRNESQISLIGLVPDTNGRDDILKSLDKDALARDVTDMLETAAQPAPESWPDSLEFGLDVLGRLQRAKISVEPGRVSVSAAAENDGDRKVLEASLQESAPEGVEVVVDISAPRPVITPYVFEYAASGNGGGRFISCTAETTEDAKAIETAARQAGFDGDAGCAIGLGAPSPDWADAIASGIAALDEMGGGRFSLQDIDATLTGPEGIDAGRISDASDRLGAALPDIFSLSTIAPPRMAATADGSAVYAPQFQAVLSEDGSVRISGALQNKTSRDAVLSYASALFGHDRVSNSTVIDPQLPEGWPGRVLTGVEALSRLKEGSLNVTLGSVALEGWGIEKGVASKLEDLFTEQPGQVAIVDVSYDADAARIASRSRPEACADEISAIMETETIVFAAGLARIEPASLGVIAATADVLKTCPGAFFEIGGHTDSQGRAETNQRLSKDRAQAVLDALESHDLALIHLNAVGYGAEVPVDDNDTAEGRSNNRRIEMTLITPDQARERSKIPESNPDPVTCAARIAAILNDAPIRFAMGSGAIEAESQPVLASIAAELRHCPGSTFEIGGHTDSRGKTSVNQSLSEDRAGSVLAALEAEDVGGVELTARGYGPDQPVAGNDTDAGREKNRRIELTLLTPLPVASAQADGDGASTDCAVEVASILENQSIQFALSSASLEAGSQSVIEDIAGALRKCPGTIFEVSGHTDDRGSTAGNLNLSEKRAGAVLAALQAADIQGVRLSSRGYGEEKPVADNNTRDGREKNRRIEVSLLGWVAGTENGGAGFGPQ